MNPRPLALTDVGTVACLLLDLSLLGGYNVAAAHSRGHADSSLRAGGFDTSARLGDELNMKRRRLLTE
jgi:hypothetical protein